MKTKYFWVVVLLTPFLMASKAIAQSERRVLFDHFLRLSFNYGRSLHLQSQANSHDIVLTDMGDATAPMVSDNVIEELAAARTKTRWTAPLGSVIHKL